MKTDWNCIRLIITDLDNTLLRRDKSISDYTVSVFSECSRRGILTAFASARAESASERFIRAIRPDIFVSNGGAVIRVRDKIIHRNPLPGETVRKILCMCKAYTGGCGGITVEAEDGYYCSFIPADPDRRAAAKYSDFSDFASPSYKITAELENEAWAQEIVRACPDCTVHSFTGEIWRRFAAHGADKENALRILAAHLRMDMAEIAAFGDDINDLGMLRTAGTGVAVANAIEEVKNTVGFLTDSCDEDGAAKFIERYILA